MAEERRSAPRARISGVRVTYESAAGDHVETDSPNIGRGGLFVRTAKPPAVGKRIALEIQVAGELTPWSALGRVVWAREEDGGERRPPGMGVKLIDVEDAVLATIDRLVGGREDVDQRLGQAVAIPAREATILGIGTSTTEAAPATPIVAVAPGRERTILGVGSASATEPLVAPDPVAPRAPSTRHEPSTTREPSVVIDLVTKEGMPAATPYEADSASDEPTVIRRRGLGRWVLVFVVLAVGAAAAYAFLDGDFERMLRPPEPAAAPRPPPMPSRTATTAATTAATTTTPTSTMAAITTATSASTTNVTPSASAAVSAPGPASASSEPRKAPGTSSATTPWRALAPPSAPSAAKRPAKEDNPY